MYEVTQVTQAALDYLEIGYIGGFVCAEYKNRLKGGPRVA